MGDFFSESHASGRTLLMLSRWWSKLQSVITNYTIVIIIIALSVHLRCALDYPKLFLWQRRDNFFGGGLVCSGRGNDYIDG